MMEEERLFLGRGWSFPPTFSLAAEGVEMVKETDDINQSLHILLTTSLGERIMQPEYGCNLNDYQFEAVNSSFLGFLEDLVETAILYYEPRIRLNAVNINAGDPFDLIEGRLLIEVDYTVRSTNSRFNFVFPFYQNEAVSDVITETQSR